MTSDPAFQLIQLATLVGLAFSLGSMLAYVALGQEYEHPLAMVCYAFGIGVALTLVFGVAAHIAFGGL